jgi:uncharacterized surface protein with fasciclin (FAS1) repeats
MKIRVKQILMAALFSVAAISAVPTSASAYSRHSDEPQGKNIVETAVAINQQTGEFSTLIAAVSCTNLVNRLQNENREFTVFAPTDAAFAKAGLNASNVCTAFDKWTLRDILRYHITRGSVPASDVLASDELHMLNGDCAPIVGATIAGQNIVQTDVMASNGIIHVVDGVMLP